MTIEAPAPFSAKRRHPRFPFVKLPFGELRLPFGELRLPFGELRLPFGELRLPLGELRLRSANSGRHVKVQPYQQGTCAQ